MLVCMARSQLSQKVKDLGLNLDFETTRRVIGRSPYALEDFNLAISWNVFPGFHCIPSVLSSGEVKDGLVPLPDLVFPLPEFAFKGADELLPSVSQDRRALHPAAAEISPPCSCPKACCGFSPASKTLLGNNNDLIVKNDKSGSLHAPGC